MTHPMSSSNEHENLLHWAVKVRGLNTLVHGPTRIHAVGHGPEEPLFRCWCYSESLGAWSNRSILNLHGNLWVFIILFPLILSKSLDITTDGWLQTPSANFNDVGLSRVFLKHENMAKAKAKLFKVQPHFWNSSNEMAPLSSKSMASKAFCSDPQAWIAKNLEISGF